jgi:hypothetical protein
MKHSARHLRLIVLAAIFALLLPLAFMAPPRYARYFNPPDPHRPSPGVYFVPRLTSLDIGSPSQGTLVIGASMNWTNQKPQDTVHWWEVSIAKAEKGTVTWVTVAGPPVWKHSFNDPSEKMVAVPGKLATFTLPLFPVPIPLEAGQYHVKVECFEELHFICEDGYDLIHPQMCAGVETTRTFVK